MNERDLDQPMASALDALAQRQQPDARFVDTLGAQLRDMAAARAQASAADDADRSTGYVETDKPLGALRRLLGLDRPRGALRPSLVVLGALLALAGVVWFALPWGRPSQIEPGAPTPQIAVTMIATAAPSPTPRVEDLNDASTLRWDDALSGGLIFSATGQTQTGPYPVMEGAQSVYLMEILKAVQDGKWLTARALLTSTIEQVRRIDGGFAFEQVVEARAIDRTPDVSGLLPPDGRTTSTTLRVMDEGSLIAGDRRVARFPLRVGAAWCTDAARAPDADCGEPVASSATGTRARVVEQRALQTPAGTLSSCYFITDNAQFDPSGAWFCNGLGMVGSESIDAPLTTTLLRYFGPQTPWVPESMPQDGATTPLRRITLSTPSADAGLLAGVLVISDTVPQRERNLGQPDAPIQYIEEQYDQNARYFLDHSDQAGPRFVREIWLGTEQQEVSHTQAEQAQRFDYRVRRPATPSAACVPPEHNSVWRIDMTTGAVSLPWRLQTSGFAVSPDDAHALLMLRGGRMLLLHDFVIGAPRGIAASSEVEAWWREGGVYLMSAGWSPDRTQIVAGLVRNPCATDGGARSLFVRVDIASGRAEAIHRAEGKLFVERWQTSDRLVVRLDNAQPSGMQLLDLRDRSLSAPAFAVGKDSMLPPPGLVYRQSGKIWRVAADGRARASSGVPADVPSEQIRISADAANAVFVHQGDIWLLDFATDAVSNLTNTPDKQEQAPQFWPNQPLIAFTVHDGASDGGNLGRLAIVNRNGSGYAVIEQAQLTDLPALAPRGEPLAYYTAQSADGASSSAKSVHALTGQITPLDTAGYRVGGPVMAADRNVLSWYRAAADGSGLHVWIQDLDSGRSVTATSDVYSTTGALGPQLAPSPNGEWVAQVSAQNDLYLHRTDGTPSTWQWIPSGVAVRAWTPTVYWQPAGSQLIHDTGFPWRDQARYTFVRVLDFESREMRSISFEGDKVELLGWAQPAPPDPNATKRQSVTANGLTVTLIDVRHAGDQLAVDVCYELPGGAQDYMIDATIAGLFYVVTADAKYPITSIGMIELKDASGGLDPQRCDRLTADVPATASLASATMAIEVIARSQPEQFDCPVSQAKLDAANSGIAIECETRPGRGGMRVVKHPESMTEEQAYQKALGILLDRVDGPWVFDVSVR